MRSCRIAIPANLTRQRALSATSRLCNDSQAKASKRSQSSENSDLHGCSSLPICVAMPPPAFGTEAIRQSLDRDAVDMQHVRGHSKHNRKSPRRVEKDVEQESIGIPYGPLGPLAPSVASEGHLWDEWQNQWVRRLGAFNMGNYGNDVIKPAKKCFDESTNTSPNMHTRNKRVNRNDSVEASPRQRGRTWEVNCSTVNYHVGKRRSRSATSTGGIFNRCASAAAIRRRMKEQPCDVEPRTSLPHVEDVSWNQGIVLWRTTLRQREGFPAV